MFYIDDPTYPTQKCSQWFSISVGGSWGLIKVDLVDDIIFFLRNTLRNLERFRTGFDQVLNGVWMGSNANAFFAQWSLNGIHTSLRNLLRKVVFFSDPYMLENTVNLKMAKKCQKSWKTWLYPVKNVTGPLRSSPKVCKSHSPMPQVCPIMHICDKSNCCMVLFRFPL